MDARPRECADDVVALGGENSAQDERAARAGRSEKRRCSLHQQRAGQVCGDDVRPRQRHRSQVADVEADRRHRIQRQVFARRLNRVRVVVDADRASGAESRRGDCEDAGSRPRVEHGRAMHIESLQRLEAETCRHMMARAESHRWLDDDPKG